MDLARIDSLAAAIAAINIPAMESPELESSVARAAADWGAATRDERILDARQWEGWEKMARKYCHSPGVREVWWPNRRHA